MPHDQSDKRSPGSYLLADPKVRASEINRLKIQAKILFEIEILEVARLLPEKPRTILDIGCGTAAHLALMGERFTGSALFGVDRNKDLLDIARFVVPSGRFHQIDLVDVKGVEEILNEIDPDLVYSRFVLQHNSIADIMLLLKCLASNRRPGRKFLFIDPDDSRVATRPVSSAIDGLVKRAIVLQKARGGDRTLGARLLDLLNSAGFSSCHASEIDVGSAAIGVDNCASIYMPIWQSGLSDMDGVISESVVDAKKWFVEAKNNSLYRLSYPVIMAFAE